MSAARGRSRIGARARAELWLLRRLIVVALLCGAVGDWATQRIAARMIRLGGRP